MGQKKSRNLSGQKQLCNLSEPKKITQPLGGKNNATSHDNKKPRNLSGQKNHTTSRDKKKKSSNLPGPKNHATSWGPKKSSNILGQTNSATSQEEKNHATSQDKKISCKIIQPLWTKKIMQLLGTIGPIASKLVHKALNVSKWHQICPNRSK